MSQRKKPAEKDVVAARIKLIRDRLTGFSIEWDYPRRTLKEKSDRIGLGCTGTEGPYLSVPWNVRKDILKENGTPPSTIDSVVGKALGSFEGLLLLDPYNLHKRVGLHYRKSLTKGLKINYDFSLRRLHSGLFSFIMKSEPIPPSFIGFEFELYGDNRIYVDSNFADELSAVVTASCSVTSNPITQNFRDYALNYFIPVLRETQLTYPKKK